MSSIVHTPGVTHDFTLLSDYDVYLFNEGAHNRLYEKLGAHAITHHGKRGVAFAVWAPNARNVSVVGNFNAWNNREHRMRQLGESLREFSGDDLATTARSKGADIHD